MDLCAPFLGALPVTGAAVTVINGSGSQFTLSASDSLSARIEELYFELGEGPQWAAMQSGDIVAIPDVATSDSSRWPLFGAALHELDAGALFCVPMRMGAVRLGVVTLYCDEPTDLDPDERTTALAIASAIAGPAALQALHSVREEPEGSGGSPALRREVHQATGIILVQLDTTATVAFARLQAYAFATGRTIESVAFDVISGAVSFEESADENS